LAYAESTAHPSRFARHLLPQGGKAFSLALLADKWRAAKVVRRLLDAGLSRFEPDPEGALRKAKKSDRKERHAP
jgi:hypothetical protein